MQYKKLKDKYKISDIYIAKPDGSVINASGEGSKEASLKVYDSEWYKLAQSNDEVIVYSDIFVDSNSKEPEITIAENVKSNDGFNLGVVAIDIQLTELKNVLEEYHIGEHGYSFIIDKEGKFVSHRNFTYSTDEKNQQTIFNISNGSLKDIGEKIIANTEYEERGEFNGETKIYTSQKVNGTEMYLVSTLELDDFTSVLNTYVYLIG